MKNTIIVLLLISITSCIPVKIAPKFDGHKVMAAKKFKRKLPNETSFIFRDTKNAEEFYTYIDKKFKLNDANVDSNLPFEIDGQTLYLSYLEAEREDKNYNLGLALVDAKRESNGNDPLFEDNYVNRTGYWYIIINVYDNNLKNCLKDDHPLKSKTIKYLENLMNEYLTTQNYEELLFTKKS
ncbi:hypothetical protein [uncultured Winogradskyella sp.]|uniref:hypothetical protein n=1 Tax=uncultured Winogradskyella sp. TaxID=395353 RepID=UPI00263873A5|nr:hypothetical protein [uncultured Winogradskyella sp.]